MGLLAISFPLLATEDRDWIQSIRRRYDPHYESVAPHVSLIFEVTDIIRDQYVAHVRAVCQATSRINLCFRCATVTPGITADNWYLFLVPDEGYSDVLRLHDRLYTDLLADHLRLDIPYIPHITLGLFDEAAACKKAADELNRERFDIPGTIASVEVVALEQERLETVGRIDLAQDPG